MKMKAKDKFLEYCDIFKKADEKSTLNMFDL